MAKLCIAVLAWCAFFVAADVAEDDGVLVLDEKNFEGVIKGNPFVLVEFYAPWCGHCKQFAPEYAAAAKQLKQAQPAPIPLAKVDATAEVKLAEEYGVRGYPTIRLFIDGKDQEYTGGRTEKSIITWVLKKVGPPAVQLTDLATVDTFENENTHRVVGFLGDDPMIKSAFDIAARRVEDVMFAFSNEAAVISKFGVTPPAMMMFFPYDEMSAAYTGDFQKPDAIEAWVKSYRHPVVSIFNGENAADIFGDGRPIAFLFRDNDDKGAAAEREFRKAAANQQRRFLFSLAGSNEPMDQRLMDYVSVEPEELPTIRLVVNPQASMLKYKLEGDITEAPITSFLQQYEGGTLRPFLKSEPVPTSQPGPVYTLVGSTFDEVVKNPAKDVLVEFYAPWCGHCKKLEPVYRDVARKLEAVNSVVIAKIDATSNDVEGVDVEGFPTIKFWPADNKEPMDYDGDRDVDSFISWLEEKATHAFSRADIRNEL